MGSSDRIFSATAKDAISQWRCLQVTFKKHSLRSPVTWEVSPAQLNRNRDNCVRAELPKFVFNPSLAASICQQSLFCESLSYLALQQKRGELHKCVSTWCYIFSPSVPGTWDSTESVHMHENIPLLTEQFTELSIFKECINWLIFMYQHGEVLAIL